MTNNILSFFREINSFIYNVKHLSISQWDVENLTQKEGLHNHNQRQIR